MGPGHVCPSHDLHEDAPSPLFGSTSFYQFNMILSGSCTAFACVVILIHLIRFANHFSNPSEQAKIMKIALLIPLYSIFSFLAICFPWAKAYMHPWVDVFQSLALASFFLLMCEYVSPSHDQRDIFFAALEIRKKKKPEKKLDGLAWYRKVWLMIFQYPVVAFAAAITTEITEAAGVFCQYNSKPYFAKLWISIIRNTSVFWAVFGVISIVMILRPHLKEQRPMTKLLAFKLVVSLSFLQNIIFLILDNTHMLEPTSKLTFTDLHLGLPSMLSCIEMVPVCLMMVHAYPVTPYILPRRSRTQAAEAGEPYTPQSYRGGPLGLWAYLEMLNPSENINGLVFAFRMAKERRRGVGGPKGVSLGEYNPLVQPDDATRH